LDSNAPTAIPHLRGHTNILKRLLIHAGGFNLGLLMRALLGAGTPRGLQYFGGRAVAAVLDLIRIAPRTAYSQSRQLLLQFRRRAIRLV
jgi:hypothetical protein